MNTICNNFTEVILNTFKNEQEERRELGMKLKQKDVEIKNLLETIINLKTSNSDLINKSITLVTKNKELESKHTEISEELTNFNKVSLLKNIHMKYDKMKNKNEVLKKRVNYYKKKALSQISKEDIIDLTSISSEQDDIVNIILSTEEYKTNDSIKKDVVIKKETIDITNEDEGVKEEKCNVSDGVDKLEKNDEKGVDVGEEEDEDVEEIIGSMHMPEPESEYEPTHQLPSKVMKAEPDVDVVSGGGGGDDESESEAEMDFYGI